MSTGSLPDPIGFHFRLLWPFHLKADVAKSAEERLHAAVFAGPRGDPAPIWKGVPERPPHTAYRDEYLREARSFLFPEEGSYFAVDPACLQSWFGPVSAVSLDARREQQWLRRREGDRPVSSALSISPDFGIELFLLSGRLGVLSISFRDPLRFPRRGKPRTPLAGYTLSGLQALQYSCSHTRYGAPVFRRPHVATDPHLAAAGPPEPFVEKSLNDDPFSERLGRAGQPFQLIELCDYLLGSLSDSIEYFEQHQYLTHLTAHFDKSVDFAEAGARESLGALLVALAQIEEPRHAAAVAGHWGIPHEVLDSKHMAAYSYLGCAHFVADQWEGEESAGSFDASRVGVMQRKYFTAFLTALAQRLVTHRFLERTARGEDVGSLWADFARFESAGCLIDVSRREAVNRCYRLAQQAQRVPETVAHVHRILRDIQADGQVRQGNDSAERMNQLLLAQSETESRLGLIEIFIVTVYTAELVNLMGECAGFIPAYRLAGILAVGAMALVTVIQHRRAADASAEAAAGQPNGGWARAVKPWFVASVALLALWMAIGLARFREP
jgi:hypothetical protein